jgi:hypothetical protein
MCSLCGVLASEHWAETDGRRGRIFRAVLLGRVLGHFGLDLYEWGGRYVVRDRKGSSVVVDDLPAVWLAAERLVGRTLDPLDPALVASLG